MDEFTSKEFVRQLVSQLDTDLIEVDDNKTFLTALLDITTVWNDGEMNEIDAVNLIEKLIKARYV